MTNPNKHMIGKQAAIYDNHNKYEGIATILGVDYRTMDNQVYCSVQFNDQIKHVYRWVYISHIL